MKIITVIILGFVLLLVLLLLMANSIEDGDSNAVSMYLVVFLLPCLVSSILNGLFLKMISALQNKRTKSILSFIPVLGLAILSLSEYIKVGFVDGNLAGIALISAIVFAITNTIWVVGLWNGSSKYPDSI